MVVQLNTGREHRFEPLFVELRPRGIVQTLLNKKKQRVITSLALWRLLFSIAIRNGTWEPEAMNHNTDTISKTYFLIQLQRIAHQTHGPRTVYFSGFGVFGISVALCSKNIQFSEIRPKFPIPSHLMKLLE